MKRIAIARTLYGATLLLVPNLAIGAVSGRPASKASITVARILGARHLAQALTLERSASRLWLLVGAGVDGLHSLSMVALAALSDGYRRPAAYDAALAGLLALGGVREVQNAR